jgi:hypothetical protein
VTDASYLDAKYQYVINEIVMLRLFSILENTIGEIAMKLACGANYRNEIPHYSLIGVHL